MYKIYNFFSFSLSLYYLYACVCVYGTYPGSVCRLCTLSVCSLYTFYTGRTVLPAFCASTFELLFDTRARRCDPPDPGEQSTDAAALLL